MLDKRGKIKLIGFNLGIDNIDNLIVKMYEDGMSCYEIAEDLNGKSSHYKITGKAIGDLIAKHGKTRSKSEAFINAIKRGRKTYKIKENKYKRMGISLARRYEILERDSFKCVLCGSRDQLEIDHIQEIWEGGKNEPENLQTLCYLCHKGKTLKKRKY